VERRRRKRGRGGGGSDDVRSLSPTEDHPSKRHAFVSAWLVETHVAPIACGVHVALCSALSCPVLSCPAPRLRGLLTPSPLASATGGDEPAPPTHRHGRQHTAHDSKRTPFLCACGL
jgi:hypothetical protein